MILITIVFVALVTLYFYATRTFAYWRRKNVKEYAKPWLFVGNQLDVYLKRKTPTQLANDIYWTHPSEKVVGFYGSYDQKLVIRDPDIIRRIFTVDFNSFHGRGLLGDMEHVEPLNRNLFTLDGDLWRILRQRMTPAFTSGKLKAMFPLVSARAERLQEVIATATAGKPRTLDARDIMSRYTIDFIGAVGFGLDADTLNDEKSAFRTLGNNIFATPFSVYFIAVLKDLFPKLCKNLRISYMFEKDMMNLIRDIVKQRNGQPSGRNDFIDLLLELRNKGPMIGESIDKKKPDGTPETLSAELDDELFAAQVFVFFAAGFETSSTATSFTLHQLAFHPEVQKKAQSEIDRVLANNDNKLSYDAVKEMVYLDWCLKEGMRMFPSLGILNRVCTRRYTIPELDVTIDPGVGIVIPIQAIQMDPQYYENPEDFRPERFSPEQFNKETMKFTYLPFGEGPRSCIGERLGLMQSLAGLAAVLSKFTVEPAPESVKNPPLEPRMDITQSIKGGVPLIFKARQNS